MSVPAHNPVRVAVDTVWPYASDWIAQADDRAYSAPCPYVDLSSITESSQPEYARVGILNRPEQILTYIGTSNREVSLTFHYVAESGVEVSSANVASRALACKEFVVKPSLWLDALKYPYVDPTTGITHAPPPVILVIGDLLSMRCVVTSCQVTWKAPWIHNLYDAKDAVPSHSEVAITFTSVSNKIVGPQVANPLGRSGHWLGGR